MNASTVPPGGWVCFFCGDTFTTHADARAHFGGDEECAPACQIKASEKGLLGVLRETEEALFSATCALHDEGAEALKAWHAAGSRHATALIAMEQVGYERGLADHAQTIEALVTALKPFADCVDQIRAGESDEEWAKFRLLIGDYRRAEAAFRLAIGPA